MFLNFVPASPDLNEKVSKYNVKYNKLRQAAWLPSEVHLLFRGCHQSMYESWVVRVREEWKWASDRERKSGKGCVWPRKRTHLISHCLVNASQRAPKQAVCENTLTTCVCRKTGFSLVMEIINHLRQSRLFIVTTMMHPLGLGQLSWNKMDQLSILVFGSFLFFKRKAFYWQSHERHNSYHSLTFGTRLRVSWWITLLSCCFLDPQVSIRNHIL